MSGSRYWLPGILSMIWASILLGDVAGPRELSRAFRDASRRAAPSVVTIMAYGRPRESEPEPALDGQPIPGQGVPARPLEEETKTPDSSDSSSTAEPARNDGESAAGESASAAGEEVPHAPHAAAELPPLPPLESLIPTGLGSGIIATSDGVVITNHHVVQDAVRLQVRMPDGRVFDGYDVRSDPASDLATFRLVGDDLPNFIPAELGSAQALEIGDWVLAIGSPFQLEATVSAGIISAKGRSLPRLKRAELLQTDAAINPGNSGGPLIDLEGQVVGINTAIATETGVFQGVGFAIPIEQVKWVTGELLAYGEVRRSSIGIGVANLDGQVAARLGVTPWEGVYVHRVAEGSPAAEAGLMAQDIILMIAGFPVNERRQLQSVLERLPVGTEHPVEVRRDGEVLKLQVRTQAVQRKSPAQP
jgi:serine protease Do